MAAKDLGDGQARVIRTRGRGSSARSLNPNSPQTPIQFQNFPIWKPVDFDLPKIRGWGCKVLGWGVRGPGLGCQAVARGHAHALPRAGQTRTHPRPCTHANAGGAWVRQSTKNPAGPGVGYSINSASCGPMALAISESIREFSSPYTVGRSQNPTPCPFLVSHRSWPTCSGSYWLRSRSPAHAKRKRWHAAHASNSVLAVRLAPGSGCPSSPVSVK